jgi:DNA-binding transcriptional ArsR family regulator
MAKCDVDQDLLDALRNPFRRSLLRRYLDRDEQRGLSPKELSTATKMPLSNIAYHVRALVAAGAIELVEEEKVRGSVAHFYEATTLARETPWVAALLGLED